MSAAWLIAVMPALALGGASCSQRAKVEEASGELPRSETLEAARRSFPEIFRQRTLSAPTALEGGEVCVGGAHHTCARLIGVDEAARPSTVDGWVVYPRALEGGDVFVRRSTAGVEDFVLLADRAASHLDYAVRLDDWVKALRLVSESLELIDERGAPRVRMAAPYLIDGSHQRRDVHVTVQGCSFDTDVRPPFGRALISPAHRDCVVRLSWDPAGVTSPIVVDPAWTTTGALATPRYRHVSARLPNGDVLVAGGLVPDPIATEVATRTAEIYSATLGAWATAEPMLHPRAWGSVTTLTGGDLLVTGGFDQVFEGQTILGSAEIYSVASGHWTATPGTLLTPRAGHNTMALGDGTVLVAAGFDNTGIHFTEAELFTESTGMFTPAGNINNTRYFQAGVTLPDGRVLLSGGTDPFAGALPSIEIYDKSAGWAKAVDLPTMISPRTLHSMVVMKNGDVLLVGGFGKTKVVVEAEVFHPATNTFSSVGALARPRYDCVASALQDGRAIVLGGQSLTGHYADGEIFDPMTSSFTRVRGMTVERALGHMESVLDDGRVMISGGYEPHMAKALAAVDLFDPAASLDGGAFLPDDEEIDAGVPSDEPPPPHAFLDGGDVWPLPGSGSPSRVRDASVDAPTDTESELTTAESLRAAGSGCGVSPGSRGGWLGWLPLGFLLLLRARKRLYITEWSKPQLARATPRPR